MYKGDLVMQGLILTVPRLISAQKHIVKKGVNFGFKKFLPENHAILFRGVKTMGKRTEP